MKKFSVILLSLLVSLAVVSCGSVQTTDIKAQAKDTAVKEGTAKAVKESTKVSCQKDCDKAAEECTKKAGKSKAQLKKCDTAKTKCYADCDKK